MTDFVVPEAPGLRPGDASPVATAAQKAFVPPIGLTRPRHALRRPQSHSYPGMCKEYEGFGGGARPMDTGHAFGDSAGVGGSHISLEPPEGADHGRRDSRSEGVTNGAGIRISIEDSDTPSPAPLRNSDSCDSFSTSPGSSENGDSSSSRGDFSEDSECDALLDCGHEDFPFCQCLSEKVSGPMPCDHEEFPFCGCLARAAAERRHKARGCRLPRGDAGPRRRRGYDIGASLSALRGGAGLEVFDETEESDFQESETEMGTPLGRHSDGDTDTEGAGGAESEVEGAVGYMGGDEAVAASPGLLAPPGQQLRRASIVTCDSRRASIVTSPEPVKIAVFGTDGVGKSALIVRLLTGRFIGEYDPTMEAVYSYQFPLEGYDLPLQVMDTAGHVDVVEEGREGQVSWGEGFMLVFSLTSHASFVALSRLRRVILELTPGAPRPMVLVGNKADLSHAREVNSEEIRDLVDCWGCDYFEVAAPEPWDVVVRPFTALYQAVLESRGS